MRYLVPVLFCLLVSGCISVSFVNMAKVSGYETALDSLQQSHVKWLSENDTLTDSPNDGNIYAVSASQLHSLIKRYPQSMVYLWTPSCPGNTCFSLSAIQQQCNERGLELFVVATSFYEIFSQNTVLIKHPVVITNERIYKKSSFEDATRQFVQELLGEKNYNNLADSLWIGRFVFREGEFVALDTP